jgi:hypothetical protein
MTYEKCIKEAIRKMEVKLLLTIEPLLYYYPTIKDLHKMFHLFFNQTATT